MTAARMIYRLIYQSNFSQSFLLLRVYFPQEISQEVILTTIIIITITNSSSIIDTFTASLFTNNSVQLQSDSAIGQLAVIEQLKQSIINHSVDQYFHRNNHLSKVINKSGKKKRTPASRSSDFVNHSYDYRPNRTSLGPITIIDYNVYDFIYRLP